MPGGLAQQNGLTVAYSSHVIDSTPGLPGKGLRNLQCMRFITRLYDSNAKYFTARAGNPHVSV